MSMKYARAAAWILISTIARRLRLRRSLVEDLEDNASMAMFDCSLGFEPVEVVGRDAVAAGTGRDEAHRGEVVEGSGQPVEPRSLDHVLSVRVPAPLAADLRDAASDRGVSLSDLLREGGRRMLPIGYRCEHLSMTSTGGARLLQVSGWCNCRMEPTYV